jgi:septum formation protein
MTFSLNISCNFVSFVVVKSHYMTQPTRQPTLILASGSPQRRRLLAVAGYPFKVVVPHESAECGNCSTTGPAGLVAELALRKGANVVEQQLATEPNGPGGNCLIIACDTVAECGGEILGKPVDEEHARRMLIRLRDNDHRVHSGLCVWSLPARDGQRSSPASPPEIRVATTHLRMDCISDLQLEEYLASGLWRGKAGAFGFQDRPGWLHITRGSESNVIGLPMELLASMLADYGY